MKLGGNKYGTQFINIEGKKEYMHDIHKIDVDETFTLIIAKKWIKRHVEGKYHP